MKIKMKLIVFLCFSVMICSLNAQESERSLLKAIEKVKKEIKSEKNLKNKEAERHKLYKTQAASRKSEAVKQLRTLKAQKDSIRKQVSALSNSNKKLAGASRYFDNQRVKFAGELAVTIEELATQIEAGFPFEAKAHNENLLSTASGLKSGSISPEEGITRAWSVLSTRLRKSLETELYSGTIEENNSESSGTYLRYGLALSLFKSEDNQIMKYYNPQSKEWVNLPSDIEMRRKFRNIFDVMEGKAPPSLVEIPIWIATLSKGDK